MHMEASDIDEQLGAWGLRQIRSRDLAEELSESLLRWGYRVLGPQPTVSEGDAARTVRLPNTLPTDTVLVEYRAKTTAAMASKLARFGEGLDEMLDIYGLRVVVSGEVQLDDVSQKIWSHLWSEPSVGEMTIRGGKMFFAPYRDYRKRDWAGVSPATTSGYTEAIHMNRKSRFGIAEVQLMTLNLYNRYCSPDSAESHQKFKERQGDLFKP